jgi:hypothetical protein
MENEYKEFIAWAFIYCYKNGYTEMDKLIQIYFTELKQNKIC